MCFAPLMSLHKHGQERPRIRILRHINRVITCRKTHPVDRGKALVSYKDDVIENRHPNVSERLHAVRSFYVPRGIVDSDGLSVRKPTLCLLRRTAWPILGHRVMKHLKNLQASSLTCCEQRKRIRFPLWGRSVRERFGAILRSCLYCDEHCKRQHFHSAHGVLHAP